MDSLPDSIIKLKWLAGLDLSENRFKEFPELLKKLDLFELNFSGNLITEFPKKLRRIRLKGDGKYI